MIPSPHFHTWLHLPQRHEKLCCEGKGTGAQGHEGDGEMAASNTASSTLVDEGSLSTLNYLWTKTSLGIPRWPVDERLGVALSINLEGPISGLVGPHTVLTEAHWETSEWVSYSA